MARQTSRNLHVPLPEETYRRLRDESARSKIPATTLAREAIQFWLEERKRQMLEDEIRAYATTHAGSDGDLDDDLEQASLESLSQQPMKPRRKR